MIKPLLLLLLLLISKSNIYSGFTFSLAFSLFLLFLLNVYLLFATNFLRLQSKTVHNNSSATNIIETARKIYRGYYREAMLYGWVFYEPERRRENIKLTSKNAQPYNTTFRVIN